MTDATDRTRESEKYLRKDSPESLGDEMDVDILVKMMLLIVGFLLIYESMKGLEPYIGILIPNIVGILFGLLFIFLAFRERKR